MAKKPKLKSFHIHRAAWLLFLAVGLLLVQLFSGSLLGQSLNVLGDQSHISRLSLLDDTNDFRRDFKLEPLKQNSNLQQAAQAKAKDMMVRDYWSHNTPDGRDPWTFIDNANYAYQNAGENLAYGFSGAANVVNAWINSPEHRANLLGDYSEVGFGLASGQFQGQNTTLVVAMYASPAGATVSKELFAANPKQVLAWQTLNQGSAAWSIYLSLIIVAVALAGFGLIHRRQLQYCWQTGKRYVKTHPILDGLVIVLIVLAIAEHTVGFIN